MSWSTALGVMGAGGFGVTALIMLAWFAHVAHSARGQRDDLDLANREKAAQIVSLTDENHELHAENSQLLTRVQQLQNENLALKVKNVDAASGDDLISLSAGVLR